MSIKTLLLSLCLSFLTVLSKNVYKITITGEYNLYMFILTDMVLLVCFTFIIYEVIKYLKNKKINIFSESKKLDKFKKSINYKNIFLFVLLVNVFSFFINYTDEMMITTRGTWYGVVSNNVSNMNPVINTFFLKPGIWLYEMTDNVILGVQFNRIILHIFNILTYTFLNCYVWKKSKNIKYLLFSLFWTMLLPLNFVFQSLVWKDTYFINFTILFSIMLYEMIDSEFKILKKIWFNVVFILVSLIMILIRNNVIVPFIVLFIISLFLFKKINSHFIINLFIVLICFFGLSKFVLPHFYVSDVSKAEFAGIKISFISRLIKDDFKLDKEDKKFMDELILDERIKENYNPNCIDSIKFSIYFDDEYFNNNYEKFNKIVSKYIKKYPLEYLKTHFISTYQYWSLYTPDYTAGSIWYFMSKTPVLNLITCPIVYLIFFISLIIKYRKTNFWLLFVFPIGVYCTLLYGVPINVSIRYIYIIFPNLVLLLLPLLDLKKKNN